MQIFLWLLIVTDVAVAAPTWPQAVIVHFRKSKTVADFACKVSGPQRVPDTCMRYRSNVSALPTLSVSPQGDLRLVSGKSSVGLKRGKVTAALPRKTAFQWLPVAHAEDVFGEPLIASIESLIAQTNSLESCESLRAFLDSCRSAGELIVAAREGRKLAKDSTDAKAREEFVRRMDVALPKLRELNQSFQGKVVNFVLSRPDRCEDPKDVIPMRETLTTCEQELRWYQSAIESAVTLIQFGPYDDFFDGLDKLKRKPVNPEDAPASP